MSHTHGNSSAGPEPAGHVDESPAPSQGNEATQMHKPPTKEGDVVMTSEDAVADANEQTLGQAEEELQSPVDEEHAPTGRRYDYIFLEGIEDVEFYRPGGFHPVTLETYLDEEERFWVAHKLGSGGYATVWLCRDLKRDEWCAVKILAAEKSNDECAEYMVVDALHRADAEDPQVASGMSLLGLPLEKFAIQGPNGEHMCFVLPVLGCPISMMPDDTDTALRKDICFQMTKAMAFLHSRGVCHGDFRPDNILFRTIPAFHDVSYEEILELYGTPVAQSTYTINGEEPDEHCPPYIVEPGRLQLDSGYVSTDIAVIDFGVAWVESETPAPGWTGIPGTYLAPETLLSDNSSSRASDVWALAASISEIQTGGMYVFNPMPVEGIFSEIEALVGPLPLQMRPAYRQMKETAHSGLDENGEENPTAPVSMPIEHLKMRLDALFKRTGCRNYFKGKLLRYLTAGLQKDENGEWPPLRLSEDEIEQLMAFMLEIWKWIPEERPTAEQLLQHSWFEGRAEQESQLAPEAEHEVEDTMDCDTVALETEEAKSKADQESEAAPGTEQDVDHAMDIDNATTEPEEVDDSAKHESEALPAAEPEVEDKTVAVETEEFYKKRRMTLSAEPEGKDAPPLETVPLEPEEADVLPRRELPVRPGMMEALRNLLFRAARGLCF